MTNIPAKVKGNKRFFSNFRVFSGVFFRAVFRPPSIDRTQSFYRTQNGIFRAWRRALRHFTAAPEYSPERRRNVFQ